MKNILNEIKFWYQNSRPYTIPITLLNWFVVYIYSLKHGGNAIFGIIAYVGIALVHLATNLSDDYIDYKRLCCDGIFINNEKSSKCRYLKNGQATINDLKHVIIILLSFAAICGIVLFFVSGWGVLFFSLAVLPIALFYAILSSRGLGDFAVILAYGPLMFEGVYYVMTKTLSWSVLILSIACAMFVNSILYAHMLMDYDSDIESGKTTLCTRLGSKCNALYGLMLFFIIGYLAVMYMGFRTGNYYYYITYLTMPLVFDLYASLKLYNKNSKSIPKINLWNYPLDNWQYIKHTDTAPFFFRFFYVRNISSIFMILTCIAIILF